MGQGGQGGVPLLLSPECGFPLSLTMSIAVVCLVVILNKIVACSSSGGGGRKAGRSGRLGDGQAARLLPALPPASNTAASRSP